VAPSARPACVVQTAVASSRNDRLLTGVKLLR
jgi:hypothetical protein